MIEIKPKYYDAFHCTADQCEITCCKEWKIYVDDETYASWEGKECNGLWLRESVRMADDLRVMHLNKDGKCPLLDARGLCEIVKKYSDRCISKTCQTFPRQVRTLNGRKEYAVVSCCPEVVRAMLDSPEYKYGRLLKSEEKTDELTLLRQKVIELVEAETYSVETELLAAFYVCLQLMKSPALTEAEISDYFEESQIRALICEIEKLENDGADAFNECNELFLDVIENYRKEGLYKSFLAPLAAQAEWIEENFSMEWLEEKRSGFKVYLDQNKTFFRQYLASELYMNTLYEDSDIESFTINLEWIVMAYVIIRHVLLLRWVLDDQNPADEAAFVEMIVIISRMMGYDEADISSYMVHSFQSEIWEWGYMYLLLGRF